MIYEYIKTRYGASFHPGDTVEHTETGKRGEVAPVSPSHAHYVQVTFDQRGPVNCHPRELKIIARGKEWGDAQFPEMIQ